MNRKASSVIGLSLPTENRRMSMAKGMGLGLPTEGPRRLSNAPKPSVSTGPSLVGLLASKRLAKRLTTRFFDRRGGRFGNRFSAQINVQKEPSYRMEPHRKFCPTKVRAVIAQVLEGRLEKFKYNPKFCSNFSKILADEIKDKVKALNFDRYKLICDIHIGEKKGQNVVSCSRSIWNDELDTFASYTFQNKYIFCTATVYGIYFE